MSALPTPNGPAPRRRTTVLIPALAVVVALGAGLIGGVFIGRHESSTTASAGTTQQFGTRSGFGTGGGTSGGAAGAGGAVSGTIASVSGSTMTVTTASGSTETVTVPSTARVSKTDTSTLSALTKGEHVTVIGTPSGSSAITARAVTEGTGFGRGARTGTGTGTAANG